MIDVADSFPKYRDSFIIESKRLWCLVDTIGKPDA